MDRHTDISDKTFRVNAPDARFHGYTVRVTGNGAAIFVDAVILENQQFVVLHRRNLEPVTD